MRTRLFKPVLMAILLMMCIISENIRNKLDIATEFLFIYAMNPDEDGRL